MQGEWAAGRHAQVKQNTEMESHEEKLHKMIIQSKINDTKARARAAAPANARCRVAAPARCALDAANALPDAQLQGVGAAARQARVKLRPGPWRARTS